MALQTAYDIDTVNREKGPLIESEVPEAVAPS